MEADPHQKLDEIFLEKDKKACKCTGPTRPAARIVKPDPTRARKNQARSHP